MFGFLKSSGPFFEVGNTTLFTKKQLTPTDFGKEIFQLSLKLGCSQLEFYQAGCTLSTNDHRLLKLVGANTGSMQLLYTNLITGSFLSYAKLVLRVPAVNVTEIENGVLSALRIQLGKVLPEEELVRQKNIMVGFSDALDCEMNQRETDKIIPVLFSRYVLDCYPEFENSVEINFIPSGLSESLTGLGSRVMAMCQNNFQLTFQQN